MRVALLTLVFLIVPDSVRAAGLRRAQIGNSSLGLPTQGAAVPNASLTNVTLRKQYPCGNKAKVAGFTKYRDSLLSLVCSVPTAAGFSCASNLKCLLNEFYTD